MHNPDSCDDCKHRALTSQVNMYECRRNPPTSVAVPGPMGQMGFVTFFPKIDGKSPCGEYTPKNDTVFNAGTWSKRNAS